MKISEDTARLIQTIASALGVLATFGAVAVALYLSRRERRIVLKVVFEEGDEAMDGFGRESDPVHGKEHETAVRFRVINLNRTPAYLMSSFFYIDPIRRRTLPIKERFTKATVTEAEGKTAYLDLETVAEFVKSQRSGLASCIPFS